MDKHDISRLHSTSFSTAPERKRPPLIQRPLAPPFLRAGRQDMIQALNLIQTVGRPRRTDQIILSFDGTGLHFDLCGMSTSIPATGIWDCQVRAKPAFVNPLIQVPLEEDLWLIHVQDNRLFFGPSFSCPCEIQPPWLASIQLPLDGDDDMLLAVKLKYSAQEIEASGLKYSVAKADGICMDHIQTAINGLSKYGLKAEDVRTLVDQRIRSSDVMKTLYDERRKPVDAGDRMDTPDQEPEFIMPKINARGLVLLAMVSETR